jgi:hypothetical protein
VTLKDIKLQKEGGQKTPHLGLNRVKCVKKKFHRICLPALDSHKLNYEIHPTHVKKNTALTAYFSSKYSFSQLIIKLCVLKEYNYFKAKTTLKCHLCAWALLMV